MIVVVLELFRTWRASCHSSIQKIICFNFTQFFVSLCGQSTPWFQTTFQNYCYLSPDTFWHQTKKKTPLALLTCNTSMCQTPFTSNKFLPLFVLLLLSSHKKKISFLHYMKPLGSSKSLCMQKFMIRLLTQEVSTVCFPEQCCEQFFPYINSLPAPQPPSTRSTAFLTQG